MCNFLRKTWQPLSGGRLLFKQPPDLCNYREVMVGCGQCMGCRKAKTMHQTTRILAEAKMHVDSCFITLSYDSEHYPKGGSLVKKDLQDFMKRLRSRFTPTKIRFYAVGEYGSNRNRPHFHVILFGFNFPDRIPIAGTYGDKAKFKSDLLREIWGKGLVDLGTLTDASAAYCAGYIQKKIHGGEAINPKTGKPWNAVYNTPFGRVLPEFALMSRRPGIGYPYLEKWMSDLYPNDKMVINGQPRKLPRYFDTKFAEQHPEQMESIKALRRENLEYAMDQYPENFSEETYKRKEEYALVLREQADARSKFG